MTLSSTVLNACQKKPSEVLNLTPLHRLGALNSCFAYTSWWPKLTLFLKSNI